MEKEESSKKGLERANESGERGSEKKLVLSLGSKVLAVIGTVSAMAKEAQAHPIDKWDFDTCVPASFCDGVNLDNCVSATINTTESGQNIAIVSAGPGGPSARDLYKFFRQEDGSWGEGQLMNSGINALGGQESGQIFGDKFYYDSNGALWQVPFNQETFEFGDVPTQQANVWGTDTFHIIQKGEETLIYKDAATAFVRMKYDGADTNSWSFYPAGPLETLEPNGREIAAGIYVDLEEGYALIGTNPDVGEGNRALVACTSADNNEGVLWENCVELDHPFNSYVGDPWVDPTTGELYVVKSIGGTDPDVYVCQPTCTPDELTCMSEGFGCGDGRELVDSCGNAVTLDCGTCTDFPNSFCDVDGTEECACTPEVACATSECGTEADGCGGEVACGDCGDGEECNSGTCEVMPADGDEEFEDEEEITDGDEEEVADDDDDTAVDGDEEDEEEVEETTDDDDDTTDDDDDTTDDDDDDTVDGDEDEEEEVEETTDDDDDTVDGDEEIAEEEESNEDEKPEDDDDDTTDDDDDTVDDDDDTVVSPDGDNHEHEVQPDGDEIAPGSDEGCALTAQSSPEAIMLWGAFAVAAVWRGMKNKAKLRRYLENKKEDEEI